MCGGCDLKSGERVKVISNPNSDYVVWLERMCNIFNLHMTNGRNHTIRQIYHCPFCGRNLEG